ncbi:MAG: glycosyltransferase [Flavobacteriales bacterium]|nr:glycosyltransferase [Flavobacteriales bacterium]
MSGWLLWLLALLGLSLFFAALVRQWTHVFRAALSPDQGPAEPVHMSVLVPARNEAGRITLLLQDLAAQAPVRPDEVIVVDDASEDGTLAQARSMATRWPALRVLSCRVPTARKRRWRRAWRWPRIRWCCSRTRTFGPDPGGLPPSAGPGRSAPPICFSAPSSCARPMA